MKPSSPYSKLFTVNEANALLPVVRPMIEKILEIIRRLRAKSEVVIRAERIDPETPNLMGRLQQNDEIAELIKQINDSVHEIQQHGCVCKGVEQGLLDFPCLLGEESQQPTCPHDKHNRKCTQSDPIFSHSSHPCVLPSASRFTCSR